MEPITFTATAIATIIFSKALETSGENLGEAVSHKIGQLLNFIRDKFQQEGVEGKLLKAQDNPSEKNQDRFRQELIDLMSDDIDFTNQLQTLIEEIKSDAKANTIFFKGMNIQGNVRLGNVKLKSQGGNISAVTDSEIGGDFTMGDVSMKTNVQEGVQYSSISCKPIDQNQIIAEISLIPEDKYTQLYELIHQFRTETTMTEEERSPKLALRDRKNNKISEIMQFAGSWSDMSEEDFEDFCEEIEQRRQASSSRRFSDETLFT